MATAGVGGLVAQPALNAASSQAPKGRRGFWSTQSPPTCGGVLNRFWVHEVQNPRDQLAREPRAVPPRPDPFGVRALVELNERRNLLVADPSRVDPRIRLGHE